MKFLDNLSLSELKELRYYMVAGKDISKNLIDEIDRKIIICRKK